jgi:hypothetical protein
VWRPAAAARNRSVREARESARQALRPAPRGARCTRCGGNAADGSADPEPKNRHGGAPRGERPFSARGASRLASAATRQCACRRSAHPSGWRQVSRPGRHRAAGTRCAVRTGCLTSEEMNVATGRVTARRVARHFASPCGGGMTVVTRGRMGGGSASKDLLAKNPPPVRICIATEAVLPRKGGGHKRHLGACGSTAPPAITTRRARRPARCGDSRCANYARAARR